VRYYSTRLSNLLTKHIDITVSVDKIETQTSLLGLLRPITEEYFTLAVGLIDVANRPAGPQPQLLEIHLSLHHTSTTNARVYSTIFDMVAQISGTLSIFSLAVNLMMKRLSTVLMMVDLSKLSILKDSIFNNSVEEDLPDIIKPYEQIYPSSQMQHPKTAKSSKFIAIYGSRSSKKSGFVPQEMRVNEFTPKSSFRRILNQVEAGSSPNESIEENLNFGLGSPLARIESKVERHASTRASRSKSFRWKSVIDCSIRNKKARLAKIDALKKEVASIHFGHVLVEAFCPFLLPKACAIKNTINQATSLVARLDYTRLLHQLEQIEKLKHFLLDPEHLRLFTFADTQDFKLAWAECNPGELLNKDTFRSSPQSIQLHPKNSFEFSRKFIQEKELSVARPKHSSPRTLCREISNQANLPNAKGREVVETLNNQTKLQTNSVFKSNKPSSRD
jgi:hypothetical protein